MGNKIYMVSESVFLYIDNMCFKNIEVEMESIGGKNIINRYTKDEDGYEDLHVYDCKLLYEDEVNGLFECYDSDGDLVSYCVRSGYVGNLLYCKDMSLGMREYIGEYRGIMRIK